MVLFLHADVQEGKLAELAGELGSPEKAVAQRCDVSDEGDIAALVQAAEQSFGALDIMVANAGACGLLEVDGLLVQWECYLPGPLAQAGCHDAPCTWGAPSCRAASSSTAPFAFCSS